MRAWLVAAVLLALLPRLAAAAVFVKGPYLQDVTRDGITFMWETDASVAGTVTVRPPSGGGERTLAAPAGRLHEVRVDGLTAGRRYQYQVTVAGESASGEFATAPDDAEPFYFVVFGDSRSNAEAHRGTLRASFGSLATSKNCR